MSALTVAALSDSSRSALDALYRETVLEHYRHPRGRQPLEHPDGSALVHNPVCGDQVRVEVGVDAGRIERVSAMTRGCSIAVASGSLMTEIAAAGNAEHAAAQHRALAALVAGEDPGAGLDERLRPFARVVEFPSRRRCATLAWEALAEALRDAGVSGTST